MAQAPNPLPGPAVQINHQRSANGSYDMCAVLKDGTVWHAYYDNIGGHWIGWEQI